MVEQDLKIIESGIYNNLELKSKPLKGIKGLEDGNHVYVEKIFVDGKEIESQYGVSYICKVKYKGTECSFFLKGQEYEDFKLAGGIGDRIKITLRKEPYVNKKTGVEMLLNKLKIERA